MAILTKNQFIEILDREAKVICKSIKEQGSAGIHNNKHSWYLAHWEKTRIAAYLAILLGENQ